MKKILLTWYGITDLRASLGFEASGGPILGAIRDEEYSDVIVLAYTRQDDTETAGLEDMGQFLSELESIRASGQTGDFRETGRFIKKYANTRVAHEHFLDWLRKMAANEGIRADIGIRPERLRHLNDTEGIYACAMRALDSVAVGHGESLVTLYISPGTPVMAFVWAFAALGHPEIKKRLISSSVAGQPPVPVPLPLEWVERHGALREADEFAAGGFDIVFHLFGEQRMPSLLGIRQFQSKKHVFVNSDDFPAACMRRFIGDAEFDEMSVSPWDDRSVHEAIVQYIDSLNGSYRVGVNLTGGTKLMFAGALSAARAIGAIPFYFNSRNRRVTFIGGQRRESIKPIDSIETFMLLNGEQIKVFVDRASGESITERRRLTETLWRIRRKLTGFYRELCEILNEQQRASRIGGAARPFRIERGGIRLEFSADNVGIVAIDNSEFRLERCADFAKYLAGGWLEEFVYLLLKPYEEKGVIKDLCINVRVRIDQVGMDESPAVEEEYNELDIAFTDGFSLYIVECKAGKVTQEQVMKLQNLVRSYGGVEGRGIVACCFPPGAESIKKKIKDARLRLLADRDLPEQIRLLMKEVSDNAMSAE